VWSVPQVSESKMIRRNNEPVIPVDVQRKTDDCGDYTRYFASIDEAQTYANHMNHERVGYLAAVRYINTDQPLQGRELSKAVNQMLKNI